MSPEHQRIIKQALGIEGKPMKEVLQAGVKAVEALRAVANSKGGQDLSGFMAHGATELANVMIHGHPAPMYAHNAAPPEQQTEADKHNEMSAARDAARDKARATNQAIDQRNQEHQLQQERGMSK
jgi:hypothetical protein